MTSTCKLWSGEVTPNGYGHLKGIYAHRLAYEAVRGPIPVGLVIRHTCGVRLCVNPEHLVIGTHLDNHNDSYERGSYAHGVTVNTAKLNDEVVRHIRTSPLSCGKFGKIFGVTDTTIWRIKRNLTWMHVK